MRLLSEARERLRALLFRGAEEAELDEELRFHVEMETEANLARGMSADEARRQALIAFGGMERFREEVRAARGVGFLEGPWRGLRFAVRRLVRDRGFSVPVIATLALGIGATTAIFALVNAVLLQPLPYPDSGRLVAVRHAAPGWGLSEAGQSDGTYLHYRSGNRTFEEMGVYYESSQILTDGDEAERIRVAMTTPSTFSVLGVRPFRGRLFTPADTERAAWVVMISHDLWVRRYGADPGIIGSTIEINRGEPREVVGVMPPGFDFPSPDTDLWWGMGAEASEAGMDDLWMSGIGRLRNGISPGDAEADLQRLVLTLPAAYPEVTPELLGEGRLQAVVTPFKDVVVGDARPALMLLLATAGFVLLVALANVANLVLVRAERQRREVAVAKALGAGRLQLAGRFLAESMVLAAVAGALGSLVAYAGVELRFGFGTGRIPRLHELGLEGAVPVAVGLSILSGALLAFIGLVRTGRPDLAGTLRGSTGRATARRETSYVQRLLVATQVGLALTLLIGSALMVQSLRRLQQIDLGFDPENVLTFETTLPTVQYLRYHDIVRFELEVLERLRAVPGVSAAEGTAILPLTSASSFDQPEPILPDGTPVGVNGLAPRGIVGSATPGYFDAMRIPLLAGRTFEPGDFRGEAPAVVLSDGLARALFRGEDAVGRRVRLANHPREPAYTVVGVVGGVPGEALAEGPAHMLYFPVLPWPDPAANPPIPYFHRSPTIVVRTDVAPASLVATTRRIVRDIDPKVPVVRVQPMEEHVRASMARPRVTMVLLLVAAASALLLGTIGIYGVLAYAVSQRTSELGVRLALGARPAGVVRMVVRQGALLALAGIAAGLLAAFALTRFLRSLLYEVNPFDPATYALIAGLLFGVAIAASYLPARRAAGIDPASALRAE